MPQPSAYPNLDRVLVIPDLNDQSPQSRPVPFSQINSQPVQWLWPNRIPLGKLTLLVGPPGVGKGLVSLDLAARVTRGDPWPTTESPAPCGTVLLLHADDDPSDVVAQRLNAAGADLNKAIALQRPAAEHPTAPGSAGGLMLARHQRSLAAELPALKSALQNTSDARLIIIDPISAFLPTASGREYRQTQAVLQTLLDIAKTHRLAIIGVAHSAMRQGVSPGRITIAHSFLRAAASILSIARDPKDRERRLLVPIKSTITAEQPALAFCPLLAEGHCTPRIEWDAKPLPITHELFAPLRVTASERQAQDALDHITVRLKEKLTDGPQSYFWLRMESPGTEQQQYRAADRLGVIKAKGGYDNSWYWMLPEQYPAWQAEQEKRREEQKRARQDRINRRRCAKRASADRANPSRAGKEAVRTDAH